MKAARGLTLLELLVVIAVIAHPGRAVAIRAPPRQSYRTSRRVPEQSPAVGHSIASLRGGSRRFPATGGQAHPAGNRSG